MIIKNAAGLFLRTSENGRDLADGIINIHACAEPEVLIVQGEIHPVNHQRIDEDFIAADVFVKRIADKRAGSHDEAVCQRF